MLRMRIDAELTLRVQIGDSHSWACVGMADLTLNRCDPQPLKEKIINLAWFIRKIVCFPFTNIDGTWLAVDTNFVQSSCQNYFFILQRQF